VRLKYSSIAIFAGGLVLGALAQYGLTRIFPTQTEKTWRNEHYEDASHARIVAFQDVLEKQGAPNNVNELTQQIELQLKIEELVIQSRAAQYANLTPITSLGSTVGALLIALLGFVAGLIGKKRRAAATPDA
jgi:membrane protein YqaA with SNARE-associated domain